MSSFPPRNWPGMPVDGRPTIVTMMSSDEFVKSAWCPPVSTMTNESFSANHPPYIGAKFERVTSPEQFAKELGGYKGSYRPYSSVFLLSFAEPRDNDPYKLGVIATIAARLSPYHDSAKFMPTLTTQDKDWMRPLEIQVRKPGYADWELKILATGKQYRKQGIADYMIGLSYAEIRRRIAKADKVERGLESPAWDTEAVIDPELRKEVYQQPGEPTLPKIRVLITGLFELTGKFYGKRGYAVDRLVPTEADRWGGTVNFNVSHMSILLDDDRNA